MNNTCGCYQTELRRRYYCQTIDGKPIDHTTKVGVCFGTKEREECSCGGDRTKCDFYPEVREKEKKEITIEYAINHFKYGISHDIFSEPVTTYAEMAI